MDNIQSYGNTEFVYPREIIIEEVSVSRDYTSFIVAARKDRAQDVVPTLRRCSKLFRRYLAEGDSQRAYEASLKAWEAMTGLFEILRNEQDQHRLDNSIMSCDTAFVVDDITITEVEATIRDRKINRHHPNYRTLSLRNTLNKIAHHNTSIATYRVDGRGAHYLVLGGRQGPRLWVAEILVSRLCKNAAAAVKALT